MRQSSGFLLKAKILQQFSTQAAFARHILMSEASLSRIIRGHRQPTQDERRLIEAALGKVRW